MNRWARLREAVLRLLPDRPAVLGVLALLVVVGVVVAGVAIHPPTRVLGRVEEGIGFGAGTSLLLALLHDKHIRTLREANLALQQRAEVRTETLRVRGEQLLEANAALESFSRNVAHDLRAPLTVIGGHCELLQDATAPARVKEHCSAIASSVAGMHSIIEGLLELSRAHEKPKRMRVRPAETALAAVAVLAPSVVEVEISEGMPDCMADPVLLQQLYTNLLSNAIKFTRGRSPARIKVGWDGEAYYVRDNGIGFGLGDEVDRMFTPFVRLKSGASHEGTGLGLAIVHTIAVSHGGRVWALGEPGWGATFFFTIPSEVEE